jgi:tripartite-type tricarboxylate transporter receptor subunit TctC
VRIVVPFAPGGTTDILARALAPELGKAFGQTFIIENKPGAGGNTGADLVAKSPPDGYTLLMGTVGTQAINPALYPKMPYDAVKDFMPITLFAGVPNVLVINPAKAAAYKITDVKSLIAYAKANPGKLNFGAAGPINLTNLAGELYKLKAGLDFVAVHFKSGAESLTCVVGDQCQLTIDNVTAVRALMEDGKLRPLAVTSARRQSDFPDLPTMIEAGVPDYVVTSFFGVVAPAGTPAPVIARLNAVINEALRTEAVQAALKKLGAEPTIESPEEFTRFIAAEMRKWSEIAAIAGIKAD